jgi:uncharacterized protein YcfJ
MFAKSGKAMVATVAVLGLGASGSALADGHGNGHWKNGGYRGPTQYVPSQYVPSQYVPSQYVYGRVVDVDPIVRYVTVDRPERQCWNETVRESNRPYGVAGPTVAGGIIGAAIGRQFGSGNDRDALTLLGAAAGAAVANQRAVRNQGYRDVTVERCEVVSHPYTEQRIDGYNVTYVYEGRHYTMQTATPPGDRVQLAVDVRPIGYRR